MEGGIPYIPVFIYVEKLVPVFVFPLGLTIALCLVALALSIGRRHLPARVVLAIIVAGLWVASMPAFAGLITAAFEDENPARPVAGAPAADVIIVLGGGIAQARHQLVEPQLGQGGDRLFEAYALSRAGKGRLILLSGGNLPWERQQKPEADVAAEVLQLLGVPGDLI